MKGLKTFYSRNKVTWTYIFLSPVLSVLSFFYIFFLALVKFLYKNNILKSYRPRLKTISVGNITFGGSGKTPFVEYLVLSLYPKKIHAAILLRGYKKPKKDTGLGLEDYYLLGDEACFLRENLRGTAGVFSSSDRMAQAQILDNDSTFDTIILDDGFQHWRLKRDLDIVMINSVNPFGNGLILPLGTLREGLGSLKRADIFCLTRVDEISSSAIKTLRERLNKINPGAGIIETVHMPEYFYDALTKDRLAPEAINGKRVGLMAGLADPSSFAKALKNLGAVIVSESYFDDHHEYSSEELDGVLNSAKKRGAEFLVTTEKDIVRWQKWLRIFGSGTKCIVLKITLKIVKGQEVLGERLHSLYRA